MTVVSVRHLMHAYGNHVALRDVSFEVAAGQVVAVLGPNGAGKTTLLEILEGFRRRSGGDVLVLGEDPERGGRSWRAQLGLVLQSTSLDAQLTVVEAVRLYCGLYPSPLRVGELLDLVGLADQATRPIGSLSSGQQRRVDLALGVAGNPRLLFLDEPTTGFDPAARRRAWQTIECFSKAGMTVLLTTHYMEEAQRLADRVIVLSSGRIVADGRADQIRAETATVIRFPLPDGASRTDLPAGLPGSCQISDGWVTVRATEVTPALGTLVDWARSHGVSLEGISVTRPSLEDVYLDLTASPGSAPLLEERAHG